MKEEQKYAKVSNKKKTKQKKRILESEKEERGGKKERPILHCGYSNFLGFAHYCNFILIGSKR